jgi:hypothetical protein
MRSNSALAGNHCCDLFIAITVIFLGTASLFAQEPLRKPVPGTLHGQTKARLTVAGKWDNFLTETFSPLAAGASIFNGSVAHITNSDPKYGTNAIAYAQRVGASGADIFTQNFFGDFAVASALHEDPRYVRRGPGYGFWSRIGYAVSRSWDIRRDAGGTTFNWDNFLGTAASAGFSNLYYPPASRTGSAYALHFITSYFGTGLGDLAPEFYPDFSAWLFHHHKK